MGKKPGRKQAEDMRLFSAEETQEGGEHAQKGQRHRPPGPREQPTGETTPVRTATVKMPRACGETAPSSVAGGAWARAAAPGNSWGRPQPGRRRLVWILVSTIISTTSPGTVPRDTAEVSYDRRTAEPTTARQTQEPASGLGTALSERSRPQKVSQGRVPLL